MRLNKWLAHHGLCSRREADEWIRQGRIAVDGLVCRELGTVIHPRQQRIAVDGIALKPPAERQYIALNKPPDVVTTRNDPQGRTTVLDILPNEIRSAGMMPVGRLDRESEGLIILSNDGDWSQMLIHPRHQIWKEYHVYTASMPTDAQLRQLQQGIQLEGKKTLPAILKRLRRTEDHSIWSIRIREGRNRQIRRMCQHIHLDVKRLLRVSIGPIRLGNLEPGSWRPLNQSEIQSISSADFRQN